jgi:hypothetical protein
LPVRVNSLGTKARAVTAWRPIGLGDERTMGALTLNV